MKFTSKAGILALTIIVCFFAVTYSMKIKSSEGPKIFEKIITSKPIGVQMRNKMSQNNNSRQNVNMIEKQSQDTESEKQMEAPTIVKSIGRGVTDMKTDAWNQAVNMTPQSISNRQAYDLMYPTHKSYYEDKKFFIFDDNFNTMEKAMVDTFEKAVDDSFGDSKVKGEGNGRINNIKSVDDIKNPKFKVDFGQIPAVSLIINELLR